MDRLAIATQGFRTGAAVVDRLAIATQGFRLGIGLGVAFADVETLGTPIDALAAMGIMENTPVPALGVMTDVLDSVDIMWESPYALGTITNDSLALRGMISDKLSLEDAAGDIDIEVLGAITDADVVAQGSMAVTLDKSDLLSDDAEDASGTLSNAPVDVEGDLT